MRVDLQIGIESDESPDTLLKHATATLAECGCKITSTAYSKRERTYTVVGALKGKPEETYRVVVNAESPEAAEDKATDEDKRRTVVAVFEGEIAPVR